MNVKLVSSDRDLHRLCTEILAELPGLRWTLSVVDPADSAAEADLCLWDFHPDVAFPERVAANPSRQLYLVHRHDLAAFHERVGAIHAAVLLKPVTRPTLAAFLSFAAARQNGLAAAPFRGDRDDILQCLIQTNLKLQEYDQDRTNFLKRAVHDFRAPLTAIDGYSDLLAGELVGPLGANQKDVLERIQHNARRLSRMAGGIFELSLGRYPGVRPEMNKGDLRDFLEQALGEIAPFAGEKDITLTVELDPCGEPLYFDGRHIEQLLINLLDNACRYTPRGGSIEIRGYPFFWERRSAHPEDIAIPGDRRRRASCETNSYRVDIHDSGTPISADRIESIFQEYPCYPGTSERAGDGLGLAVCKMIAGRHEGRIWAENTRSGPVFSFVLPLRPSRPLFAIESGGATGTHADS